MVKTPEEHQRLIAALRGTEQALRTTVGQARAGVTERELAHVFEAAIVSKEARPGFTLLRFGRGMALVQVSPGATRLEKGDYIWFDVGCTLNGYRSDIGRIVSFGEPSDKLRTYYNASKGGQSRAFELMTPGRAACDVFNGAVERVRELGIPHYRRHHVGHGIGVEYYNRPIAYFERLRQMEETADQVLEVFGPLCYLTTSDVYDAVLTQAFEETADQPGADRATLLAASEQILGTLAARKRMYAARRPGIICMVSLSSVRRLLESGIADGLPVSEETRLRCRQIAEVEVRRMAELMEAEPMGLQFGLLSGPEPSSQFTVLRARDRVSLAINPFRADTHLGRQSGVAMVTSADEAVLAHQRVAEASWREALKGAAGAARLRRLLGVNAEA